MLLTNVSENQTIIIMTNDCSKNYRLNPAWGVALMCSRPGKSGPRVLAELADVAPNTVWAWFRPKDRNGTGGLIPSNKQLLIHDKARERGINITPAQIIGADNAFFEHRERCNGRSRDEDLLG